jgi:hypothetical protein
MPRASWRRLALENIGNMRVPQWQLADSVDSAALYEAIEKRFDPASANSAHADESARQPDRDYRSSEATAWYFLASVIAGKQSDAERALVKLSRGSSLYIPRDVQALRRAGLLTSWCCSVDTSTVAANWCWANSSTARETCCPPWARSRTSPMTTPTTGRNSSPPI